MYGRGAPTLPASSVDIPLLSSEQSFIEDGRDGKKCPKAAVRIGSRNRLSCGKSRFSAQADLAAKPTLRSRRLAIPHPNRYWPTTHMDELFGTSGLLKRPPKRPDRVYPVVKSQEYDHVYDWEYRPG
jgi:hypothetical protein